MASSVMRGTVLRRNRLENKTLSGRGSFLRSLSSSDPVADIISSDPLANIEFIPDDVLCLGDTISSPASSAIRRKRVVSQDDIFYALHSTEAYLHHVVKCENGTGIIYRALNVINHHSIFETCSIDTKLKVLSTAFDQIKHYFEATSREIFLMNLFIRSMTNDDSKNDITKDEVISRVLDVIERYPKPGQHKVTQETHFRNDLRFNDYECGQVQKLLYLEFKLYVRAYESCKEAIDYIYNNPMERIEFEEFRRSTILGDVFWPRPL